MTQHFDLLLEEMVLVEFEELTNKIQVYQTSDETRCSYTWAQLMPCELLPMFFFPRAENFILYYAI